MWYTYPNNGVQVWQNASQIFQNITNSTSPVGAINQAVNTAIPWFWPLFPFALYLYLLSVYSDSPSGGKLYMISALVLVVSAFMALGGYLLDGVINVVIFLGSFWLSRMFRKY